MLVSKQCLIYTTFCITAVIQNVYFYDIAFDFSYGRGGSINSFSIRQLILITKFVQRWMRAQLGYRCKRSLAFRWPVAERAAAEWNELSEPVLKISARLLWKGRSQVQVSAYFIFRIASSTRTRARVRLSRTFGADTWSRPKSTISNANTTPTSGIIRIHARFVFRIVDRTSIFSARWQDFDLFSKKKTFPLICIWKRRLPKRLLVKFFFFLLYRG